MIILIILIIAILLYYYGTKLDPNLVRNNQYDNPIQNNDIMDYNGIDPQYNDIIEYNGIDPQYNGIDPQYTEYDPQIYDPQIYGCNLIYEPDEQIDKKVRFSCRGLVGQPITAKLFEEYLGRPVEQNIRYDFLKNPLTKRNLEYDIYDPITKIAIEYNGIQHYQYPNPFHKTQEEFDYQVLKDNIKRELAFKNGDTLIVVGCFIDEYTKDGDNYIKIKTTHLEREEKIKNYLYSELNKIFYPMYE